MNPEPLTAGDLITELLNFPAHAVVSVFYRGDKGPFGVVEYITSIHPNGPTVQLNADSADEVTS